MESTLSVVEEEARELQYDDPTLKRGKNGAGKEASESLADRLESIRTRMNGLVGMKLSKALDLLDKTPTQFTVEGNVPNPVSTTTSITYGLEEEASVTVEVYDITGRHMRTLVDERQRDGFHRVRFNAKNLASGTYVYRVQAGEQVEAGKMTVVK